VRDTFIRNLWIAFGVLWCALAIAPKYRADWAVENALVLILVAGVWAFRRQITLSRGAWLMLVGFLALHEIGAHYTYSEVPYDRWFHALTGHSLHGLLGWQRNHYDRFVHFCAGLMLLGPMRELFQAHFSVSKLAGCLLSVNLIMSGSMLYELVEWAAALVFGGDLGAAYLGTQGDPWDAQKDMALASLGAIVTAVVTLFDDATY